MLFFSKKFHFFQYFIPINKEKQNALHQFYTQNFPYYKLLDSNEKRKFLVRIINIRKRNALKISPKIKNTNGEVELLICGAFAQITFGYYDYEITTFTKVIVNPKTFYSKLVNHEVKGLTVGNGYIFYSWADFLKGYKLENDKINLALHELAHALYIDRFHNTANLEWTIWEFKAKTVLEIERNGTKTGLFRPYAQSNLHEFWAVSIECFFEDPINFKKQYPHLYQATASILRQDMAVRKMSHNKNLNTSIAH